jgi:protein dispatched 1
MIKKLPTVTERDAIDLALQSLAVDTGSETTEPLTERSSTFDFLLMVEARKADDILASDGLLREMQGHVNTIISDENYAKVCHTVNQTHCSAPVCIVEFGNMSSATRAKFQSSGSLQAYKTINVGMTQAEREAVIDYYLNPEPEIRAQYEAGIRAAVSQNVPPLTPNRDAVINATVASQMAAQSVAIQTAVDQIKGLRSLFFDRRMSSTNKKAKYLRCMFPMGTPLPGFANENDRELEQRKKWDSYTIPLFDKFNKQLFFEPSDTTTYGLRPIIFGTRVMQQQFAEAAVTDMIWAIGSVVFVFLYMIFHTGSVVVAWIELMQILMSLPLALFFYKIVFGIGFFQTLHSLSIFIILGLGCDGVFIFIDAWNQAPVNVYKTDDATLIKRMEYTYRRASKALFVTSFTTFAAFMATGMSDIMPIATFGVFSATLVMANFLLDIVFLPAIVVLWERYLRDRERNCAICCCSQPLPPPAPLTTATAPEALMPASSFKTPSSSSIVSTSAIEASKDEPDAIKPAMTLGEIRAGQSIQTRVETDQEAQANRAIERFFRDYFSKAVHYVRYLIVIIGVGVIAASAYASSTLKPLSKQEQWFPTWHFVGSALDWTDKYFGATENDRTVDVRMVWGVLTVDRTGTNFYDPADKGKVVWDSNFRPSRIEAQELFLSVCDDLEAKNIPGGQVNSIRSCWPEDFRKFLTDNGAWYPLDINNNTITGSAGAGFAPASTALVSACNTTTNQSTLFNCALQLYTTTAGSPGISQRNKAYIGFGSGGRLRLVTIVAETKLRLFEPYATNLPVLEAWQAYLGKLNERGASFGAGHAVQTAGFSWAWMFTERALVTNAIQGIAVSISVALVVLIISTNSIPVGLFATITIAGIVLSVLALMVILGWELGTTESVSSVILIGYSVDYAVHLANAYQEAGDHHSDGRRKTRFDRTQAALTEYGVSIIAGAITTFGAGVFLLGGLIIFFQKFAVLIMSSIAFSLVWALTFLPALLMVAAPEDGMCAVSALVCCRLRPAPSAPVGEPPAKVSASVTAPDDAVESTPVQPFEDQESKADA